MDDALIRAVQLVAAEDPESRRGHPWDLPVIRLMRGLRRPRTGRMQVGYDDVEMVRNTERFLADRERFVDRLRDDA